MLTLANRLTILRILITPAVVILMLYNHMGAAIALFLVAGVTDGLDGFVARRRGQRTALGMVLDPLADKLLLMSSVVALTVLKELPRWFTIILVSRDLILIGGSLIIHMFVGKRSFPPSWLGKWTTALQIATVLLAMLDNLTPDLQFVVMPCAMVSTLLTISSGLQYISRGTRLLNDQ